MGVSDGSVGGACRSAILTIDKFLREEDDRGSSHACLCSRLSHGASCSNLNDPHTLRAHARASFPEVPPYTKGTLSADKMWFGTGATTSIVFDSRTSAISS